MSLKCFWLNLLVGCPWLITTLNHQILQNHFLSSRTSHRLASILVSCSLLLTCDKPVLMIFALLFVVFSLLSWIKLVTMSEFLICLFSKVIMITQIIHQYYLSPNFLFSPIRYSCSKGFKENIAWPVFSNISLLGVIRYLSVVAR